MKEERQQSILKILREKEFASAQYLSKKLYVSLPTIRRDLNILQKRGLIERSSGGAMLLQDSRMDIPIVFRSSSRMDLKSRLCRLAAPLVKEGDVVFIDASTTTLHLVDHIKSIKNITVVTNSVPVCNLLYRNHIKAYCAGGFLVESSYAFVGTRAEEFISDFNANIVFFSSCALDNTGLVTDYSERETSLRKTMLRHAQKRVFLCDENKLGKSSAFNVCSVQDLDVLVTNFRLPEKMQAEGVTHLLLEE